MCPIVILLKASGPSCPPLATHDSIDTANFFNTYVATASFSITYRQFDGDFMVVSSVLCWDLQVLFGFSLNELRRASFSILDLTYALK